MSNLVHTFFTTTRDGPMTEFKNRRRFLQEQGMSSFKDVTMSQVHGDNIAVVDENYENGTTADGLVTNLPKNALFSKAADCPPVLFHDPKKGVIGAAHCGYRSTFALIAEKMISIFISDFGSSPEDIIVKIGPGIGICCFEVNADETDFVRKRFGSEFVDGQKIDLQGINKHQVISLGVKSKNVSVVNICTCCDENYFSYQRMGFIKNFAGIIALC